MQTFLYLGAKESQDQMTHRKGEKGLGHLNHDSGEEMTARNGGLPGSFGRGKGEGLEGP